MKGKYLLLAAAVVILALTLTALGRPRRAEAPRPTATAAPVVELAIEIHAGQVSPSVTAVPKGTLARLRVEHRGDGAARLALAGYEDRLEIPELAPGAVWTAGTTRIRI